MLKRVFVAPDPGRVRLRFAGRGVLGISLAVALCGLAGHSLVAAITGGLAALLALFTVTDPTVRGQAVTTALLPAVGLPVLAVAAVLHDQPAARDLIFLAVMGAGVYARRWGPRGHALGVFAFMMFFAAQFLHTVPGQLPELYVAVLLSLGASAVVRFGLWCYERRLPVVAAPAPPEGRGPLRITTRQAVQATLGGAFALGLGQLLSDQRWYWAVGATWWVFVNTTSRGETLVRGFRRVLGTVIGIVAGFAVAIPLDGAGAPTAAVVAVSVFGIFYTAAVSYSWMMFFVTVMAGMLYGVLGVLDSALLWLRVAETAVGSLGAVLAVLLVLPVTTHAITDAWIQKALRCVHACTAEAADRLAGSTLADPAPASPNWRCCSAGSGSPSRRWCTPEPAAGPQGARPAGARAPGRLRHRGPGPGLDRRRPGRLARRAAVGRVLPRRDGRRGAHRARGLPRLPPARASRRRGPRPGPPARTGACARRARQPAQPRSPCGVDERLRAEAGVPSATGSPGNGRRSR